MRDVEHDLQKLMHSGGTTEAWSKALCNPIHYHGNLIMLSNKFNTFLDDLGKYSSLKGDKSLLYNMFDGISIKRSIISGSKMNVDKVSARIAGIMQPEFALPNIEASNDLHGLCRHFSHVHLVFYFYIITNLLLCRMKFISNQVKCG